MADSREQSRPQGTEPQHTREKIEVVIEDLPESSQLKNGWIWQTDFSFAYFYYAISK